MAGWRWVGLGLMLLCSLQSVWAQAEQTTEPEDTSPHSEAQLVSAHTGIQPGQPFTVAMHMLMDEGWHSYWKNAGDSGQETYIEWALPEGFIAGEILWPYPHRIDLGPLTSYGYSDEVFLLTEITPPSSLQPGTTITIEGVADWLICAEICLPAKSDIHLTLPV